MDTLHRTYTSVDQHDEENPNKERDIDTTNLIPRKKASDDDADLKLFEIDNKCEAERQMHRLAQEYYKARDDIFHFFPLTGLVMVSGIVAFYASTSLVGCDRKEELSYVVGVINLVIAAIETIAKNTKYASRSDMHKMASLGMKKLTDSIEFERIDPQHGIQKEANKSSNDGQDVKNKKDGHSQDTSADTYYDTTGGDQQRANTTDTSDQDANKTKGGHSQDNPEVVRVDHLGSTASVHDKVEQYHKVFEQILASCDSVIPNPISQAFQLVESRLGVVFGSGSHSSYKESILFKAVYNELYVEMSNATFWPWKPLNPHVAVNKALSRAIQCYSSRNDLLYLNHDFDEGLSSIFCWTFCFCCDSTSWFWFPFREKRRNNILAVQRQTMESKKSGVFQEPLGGNGSSTTSSSKKYEQRDASPPHSQGKSANSPSSQSLQTTKTLQTHLEEM